MPSTRIPALALLVIAAAASCFPPDLGDGKVRCGERGECPQHYYCHSSDNRCWKMPETTMFDLAGVDLNDCVPAVCDSQCGVIPDNCGSMIDCGMTCPTGETCGGGGIQHACGCPTQQFCGGRNCGTMPNGCGDVTVCGTSCPTGQTCGGGGTNICGTGSCTPMANVPCPNAPSCGYVSDGCAAVVQCKCPGNKKCTNGTCM